MSAALPARLPARRTVGALALGLVLGLVLLDLARTGGLHPLALPPPVALGSGLAPSGAHCTQG